MSSPPPVPVPYLIDPAHLAFDDLVTFCVSILVAVLINAEGQAHVATFLGDFRPGAKDRLHFNAFLHLDILGTLCFLVDGFGWARKMEVDPSKFRHPRPYLVVTRFFGPIANLLMAAIVSSIVVLLKIFDLDPRVFNMLIGVNVTMAVYNLIPLPPLAAGALVRVLIPAGWARLDWWFSKAGPFLVLALALLERLSPHPFLSPHLNPLVVAIYKFIAE